MHDIHRGHAHRKRSRLGIVDWMDRYHYNRMRQAELIDPTIFIVIDRLKPFEHQWRGNETYYFKTRKGHNIDRLIAWSADRLYPVRLLRATTNEQNYSNIMVFARLSNHWERSITIGNTRCRYVVFSDVAISNHFSSSGCWYELCTVHTGIHEVNSTDGYNFNII